MSAEQDLANANVQIANLISEVTRFRDAAMGLNAVYSTITEGRQNTADGKYFSVPGNGAYMRLYRRNGSQAQLIAEYPSRESMVAAINEATADAEARANAAADRAEVYADNKEFVTLERIRKQATLDLDFASGDYALDDGDKVRSTNATDLLTVERVTPKWVEGPNGKLREVPPNTIARAWRNGVPQGALIEESKTNLHLYSTDITNAGVSRQNCDITVSSEVSPIIGQSAFTIEATAEGVSGIDSNSFSVVAGRKYTATVIAKAGTANGISVVFKNFVTGWRAGTVNFDGTVDASVGLLWKLEEQYIIADGWTFARVSCVADQDSDSASIQYRVMNDEGDAGIGGTIHVAHWQVEEGEGSSIIPTTDSQVTRAGDDVYRTLGDEFNPLSWTLYLEVEKPEGAGGSLLSFSAEGNQANSRAPLFIQSDRARFEIKDGEGGGVLTLSAPVDSFTKDVPHKMAIAVSSGYCAMAFNGAVVESSAVQFDPLAYTDMFLANNWTGGSPNRQITPKLSLHPRALSEQELQEITT
ncbi:phage head spike fiber domain-containing protein [Vreelandella aquamarina]|uniref:phage head spike fiber domain-containing protein n=1 Tax=Vreelandella aquamarina TaxID=77097 RepID=UPI000786657E|nr:hypothetical protein [Halomonas axialensis]